MIDLPSSTSEILVPPTIVLRDNFDHGFDSHIWSDRKIEPNRLRYGVIDQIPAITVSLLPGDKSEISKISGITERTELMENPNVQLPHGINIWYGLSFRFPPEFIVEDSRLIFAQWKQKTPNPESPFMCWRYRNGELMFTISGDNGLKKKFRQEIDPRNQWMRTVVNYQLNPGATSHVSVWLNDLPFAKYSGLMGYQSMVDNQVYFKTGLYRDHTDHPASISLAHFRRGSSIQETQI